MVKKEKELISFRINVEKRDALDALANFMDRDRSYVLNEAVEAYLDLNEWQMEQIKRGLAQAEAGKFADDKQVEAFFAKWSDAD